jgi:hypothetical protein
MMSGLTGSSCRRVASGCRCKCRCNKVDADGEADGHANMENGIEDDECV